MIYLLGAATWHLAPRTWQPRLVSLSYGANTAIRVSAWLGRPLATLSWKYEVAPGQLMVSSIRLNNGERLIVRVMFLFK